MFDTIVNPSSGIPRQRWTTTAMSAAGHVAVMIALVLSTITRPACCRCRAK